MATFTEEQKSRLMNQIIEAFGEKNKEEDKKESTDKLLEDKINKMIADFEKNENAEDKKTPNIDDPKLEVTSSDKVNKKLANKLFGLSILHAAAKKSENINFDNAFKKYIGLDVDDVNKAIGDGADIRQVLGDYNNEHKALDGGTATGAEYIQAELGREVFERASKKQRIEPLFQSIDMPTNPWKFPVKSGQTTIYHLDASTMGSGASATAIGDSEPATANTNIEAKKLGGLVYLTEDFNEDSLIAAIPFLQDDMISAMGKARDYCIVRGDTATGAATNVNNNAGSPTTTAGQADRYLAFDGLIKKTFTTTYGLQKNAGATLALTHYAQTAAAMDDDFMEQDGVWLMGHATYWATVDLLTKTGDYGTAGTISNGKIASLYGFPVVKDNRTMFLSDDDGKYDDVTAGDNDQKNALLVDKTAIRIYNYRRVIIKSDMDIKTDQRLFTITSRLVPGYPFETSTSVPGIVYLFNAD